MSDDYKIMSGAIFPYVQMGAFEVHLIPKYDEDYEFEKADFCIVAARVMAFGREDIDMT